jgi:hypothetical protein
VVSEPVTTAIRYGKHPIKLRMILQSALTCEVSDTSSTAPHLRRARVFDEGGRGPLLVAHPTEHRDTRHNREGKAIWGSRRFQLPLQNSHPLWREVLARAAPRDFVPHAGTHLPLPTRTHSIMIVL